MGYVSYISLIYGRLSRASWAVLLRGLIEIVWPIEIVRPCLGGHLHMPFLSRFCTVEIKFFTNETQFCKSNILYCKFIHTFFNNEINLYKSNTQFCIK